MRRLLSSLRSELLLGVILILAVAVRLWGIDFGLPYAYHVDEPRFLNSAVGILQSGSLNPGWFYQPTLYTYLVTIVIGGYYVFGRLTGLFQSTGDLFQPPYHFDGFIELPAEFLLARLLTAFFGLATVIMTYYVAKRWMGQVGAVVAALLLSVSIFHVSSSHFIATDVPVAFFILLTLFAASRIVIDGSRKSYVLAGISVGLAVGTKYSAYVLFIPVLIAHLVTWRKGQSKLLSASLVWLALSTAITAFLTTPFSVLDSARFIQDVRYELQHHRVLGHIGAEGNSAYWLANQLLSRSDRWLTISALIGFGLALWKREWRILLVLSFSLSYFVTMASNLVRFERFLVPLIPALALAAGYTFSVLYDHWPRQNARIVLVIIAILLLVEPIIAVAKVDRTLAQPDVRTKSLAWIEANIATGAQIAKETYTPNLDGLGYDVSNVSRLNDHPFAWYVSQGFDYLIFSEARFGNIYQDPERYSDLIAGYDELFDNLSLVAKIEGSFVDRPDHAILIYQPRPWPSQSP